MSRNRYSVARAVPLREITTAVLIDDGFYRKRVATLSGHKTAEKRADELVKYCRRHIRESRAGLYRIFYYDYPLSQQVVYHLLLQQRVNPGKSELFTWTNGFLVALVKKRRRSFTRQLRREMGP